MILENLSLVNFKNYESAEITFSEKINCFIGNNGSGKTNMLDAIHYLSLCKSYFNSSDSLNIRFGNDFFVIEGKFANTDNSTEEIYCGFKRNAKKMFKRNDNEYDKLSDHIGLIPLIVITPSDNILITEGSEERRKLVDSIISQYNHKYLEYLIKYNKSLVQRNKLLKEFSNGMPFNSELLETYNVQLAMYGVFLFETRQKFFVEYLPIFNHYYQYISGDLEKVEIEYESQLHEGNFEDLLTTATNKDRAMEYTTVGIHKDDFIFKIDQNSLKKIGSQGQQKTFLVALKFAEFEFISKSQSTVPLLLLDDIFDKFDSERVKKIIQLVADNKFGQIFITDTNAGRIDDIIRSLSIPYKLFRMSKGTINEEK